MSPMAHNVPYRLGGDLTLVTSEMLLQRRSMVKWLQCPGGPTVLLAANSTEAAHQIYARWIRWTPPVWLLVVAWSQAKATASQSESNCDQL